MALEKKQIDNDYSHFMSLGDEECMTCEYEWLNSTDESTYEILNNVDYDYSKLIIKYSLWKKTGVHKEEQKW